jgi:cysteinyl-tRNA synthetase
LGDFDTTKNPIPEGLQRTANAFETFTRFMERYERITKKRFLDLGAPTSAPSGDRKFLRSEFSEFYREFRQHMDDDFNTGGAVAVLFELVGLLNRLTDSTKLEDSATPVPQAKEEFEQGALLLKELGQILGLFVEAPKTATSANDQLVNGLMQLVIELRNNFRVEAKKITDKADPTRKMLFEQTDLIRKRLADVGVTLEDRSAGTTWRVG